MNTHMRGDTRNCFHSRTQQTSLLSRKWRLINVAKSLMNVKRFVRDKVHFASSITTRSQGRRMRFCQMCTSRRVVCPPEPHPMPAAIGLQLPSPNLCHFPIIINAAFEDNLLRRSAFGHVNNRKFVKRDAPSLNSRQKSNRRAGD